MNPVTTALLRHLMTLLASLLLAHGFTHAAAFLNVQSNVEEILAMGGLVYSLWLARKANAPAALIQKAAEAAPAGTVIVATSEDQPKAPAQVLPPEDATTFIRRQGAGAPLPEQKP